MGTELPYVVTQAKLTTFISKIPEMAVPSKINGDYLVSIGYKSSNDRAIISLLKSLGFIDSNGVPLQSYKDYRDKSKSKKIMANAIKKAYAPFFKIYPDAQDKDEEAIRNVISSNTTSGKEVANRIYSTFKTLVTLSDFSDDETVSTSDNAGTAPLSPLKDVAIKSEKQPIILNINIQLSLPETKDPEVYKNLFESMNKYILNYNKKTESYDQ